MLKGVDTKYALPEIISCLTWIQLNLNKKKFSSVILG